MNLMARVLLSSTLCIAAPATAEDGALKPFKAHYFADWKGINVAASDIELKAGDAPDEYVYRWSIAARGIFKVAYSDPVIQTSWLKIENGHVRPYKYQGEEGGKTVKVEFNWDSMRGTGTSEDKPLDLALKEGAQDLNSIQVEIMTDLKNGDLPKSFQILDKDQLKDFDYTNEGPARIRTELGELDTVVVASSRQGNDRVMRIWFAPSLGFVPVQAERRRHGNVEFSMKIQSLNR